MSPGSPVIAMKLRSTRSSPSVTVLAPGLLGPWPPALHREVTAGLALPALSRMLARARTARSPFPPDPEICGGGESGEEDEEASLEAVLASAVLGLRTGGEAVPAGPLSLVADQRERPPGEGFGGADGAPADPGGEGWVLRVEPLHVVADLRGARVWRGPELDIGADEARGLLARLDAGSDSGPGRLVVGSSPERWYLLCRDAPRVRLAPIGRILSEGPGLHPPRGPDAPGWQRWLTEVQMLLHDAPENLARMGAGKPAINALWAWGGGPRGETGANGVGVPPWDHVWSREPFVRGGAIAAGSEASMLPPDGVAWGRALPPGESLVVWEEAWPGCATRSVEAWRAALEHFEARWAEPLEALVEAGRIGRLVLDVALRPGDPRHVLGPPPPILSPGVRGRSRLRARSGDITPWLLSSEEGALSGTPFVHRSSGRG